MISIIVLTYNRFKLLVQTLDSILKQSYRNIEIIIVNDGSNDETVNIKSFIPDERIKLFNLVKQNNLAVLRNYGIQQSEGEFIAFCDDDDLWVENKLEIQIPLLQSYDFVCSNAKLIDINNRIVTEKYINFQNSQILDTKTLLLDNVVMPSSVVFHKKILKDNKPFDEFNYINLCEDYNLWIKLSSYSSMYFLNEELILHRTHESWARSFKHSQQIYFNHISLMLPFTTDKDPDLRNIAYKSIINNKINQIKNLLNYKKYFSAFKYLVRLLFLILNPLYLRAILSKFKSSYHNKKEKETGVQKKELNI